MRAVLLVLISLVFAGCEAAQPSPQSLQAAPLEEDWAVEWWMSRHEQKRIDKTRQDVDLIFIGDSITHGWETDGKTVWDEFYAERNGFNLGFSGDRTENVLWRLHNGAVDGLSPKLVVMMIGTNNTGHRMDPAAHTLAGIDDIIRQFKKDLPDTEILLLAIFPRGKTAEDPMRIQNEKINALLAAREAEARVTYVNINSVFLNETGGIDEAIMPDLLHLSPEGYALWAEAIEPYIVELMGTE